MADSFEESMTRIRKTRKLLEGWRGELSPKITNQIAAGLLEAGFVLSQQFIDSIELLSQHGLGMPALIIARSQFECSCNLRWASLADGWVRLRASECKRVVDDHRSIGKHFQLTELPESIRSETEKVQNRIIDKPPGTFKQLLKEIAEKQADEGQQSNECRYHEYQYEVTYSRLSRAVHARLMDATLDVDVAIDLASTAIMEGILILLMAAAKEAGESYSPVFQSALPLFSEDGQRAIRERVAERRRSQE